MQICKKFPHKYLTVFTDSRNTVTTLLNPQQVYVNLETLRSMWSILEHYRHSEVFWVPRNNSEISKCDEIARADIVVPTDTFLHEFYDKTHIVSHFVVNQQTIFMKNGFHRIMIYLFYLMNIL